MPTFKKPSLKKAGRRNLIIIAFFVFLVFMLLKIQHAYLPTPSGLLKDWAIYSESFLEWVVSDNTKKTVSPNKKRKEKQGE